MKVLILPDATVAAERVAKMIADHVATRPDAVLGLATGETMRPVYARLAALHGNGALSLAGITSFNLDEYIGIDPDHPASFTTFMRAALSGPTDMVAERMRLPRGDAPDPQAEAVRYDAAIAAAGGIGLQLLGLGRNGHVAFNEPTSSLASRTRVKALTRSTREANAPAFAPVPTPTHAITVGLGTILEARECLLLATGAAKAQAAAAMIEGPLGAHCPASALQLHPRATVVLDADAAAELTMRDYYETVHPGGAATRFG